MPNLTPSNITLVSSDYPAPYQGISSSEDFNDFQTGVLLDLLSLAKFINSVLIPMIEVLPNTAQTGLQGSTIYGDTTDQTSLFYDSADRTSLTIADSIRQLSTQLGGQTQTINNLSALVGELQQQLSANNQYDVSIALNSITSTLAQITSEQLAQNAAISTLQGQVQGLVPAYQTPTFTGEYLTGTFPGTVYTISNAPSSGKLIALYYNAGYLQPTQYTISGTTITTNFTTSSGDSLYAVYFY